jgi:hypothetical protein
LGENFPRLRLRINIDKNALGYILGKFSTTSSGHPVRRKYRTLRESFLMAVKKAPTLENLKHSFGLFRVPEEDLSAGDKNPPEETGSSTAKVRAKRCAIKQPSGINVITF